MSTPSIRLDIRHTGTSRGRGVFVLDSIAENQLVETAPVLVIKCDFEDLPALLTTYVFDWETLAGVNGAHAVGLGYASMYNHANPANLRYEADARESLLRFYAVRPIEAGEELTINYNAEGGAPVSTDNNWFERHDVEFVCDEV